MGRVQRYYPLVLDASGCGAAITQSFGIEDDVWSDYESSPPHRPVACLHFIFRSRSHLDGPVAPGAITCGDQQVGLGADLHLRPNARYGVHALLHDVARIEFEKCGLTHFSNDVERCGHWASLAVCGGELSSPSTTLARSLNS